MGINWKRTYRTLPHSDFYITNRGGNPIYEFAVGICKRNLKSLISDYRIKAFPHGKVTNLAKQIVESGQKKNCLLEVMSRGSNCFYWRGVCGSFKHIMYTYKIPKKRFLEMYSAEKLYNVCTKKTLHIIWCCDTGNVSGRSADEGWSVRISQPHETVSPT